MLLFCAKITIFDFFSHLNILIMPRAYNFIVNSRDIDFSKRASLTTISDYVIQAAVQDSDSCNSGLIFLNSHNLTWVMIRMAIEMVRYPMHHEKFKIETWVESIDKLMVRRNMTIYGEDDDIVGHAITYWCIIDLDTRRTIPCNDGLFAHFCDDIEPIAPVIKAPERVRAFSDGVEMLRTVRYSHIDFNEHTNTTKYIAWMLNGVDMGHFKKYDAYRLDINFSHESRYGDEVAINVKQMSQDSNFSSYSLTNKATGQNLCNAKIFWRDKK